MTGASSLTSLSLNLLAAAFYRVCAESPTQPLACSVSLPVGVPNLVDVTGDNFPDVIANVIPLLNPTSVGVTVYFAKLQQNILDESAAH